MKPIQILGQKTIVADSRDSRNSIRPLLEEAGFTFDYDRYSRILSVNEGKETLAQIRGIKGIQDFRTLGYSNPLIPYFIAGSDIVGEVFLSSRRRIDQVLDLGIGKCSLELLTSPDDDIQTITQIDTVFTKYPRFLKAKLDSILGDALFGGNIQYSDSPDTTLAYMLSQQREQQQNSQDDVDSIEQFEVNLGVNGRKKKIDRALPSGTGKSRKLAAWEIVETGNSAQELGLKRELGSNLTVPVSTVLYRQSYFGGYSPEPQMEYFIERVRGALENT